MNGVAASSRRRMRTQTEWKVPISGAPRNPDAFAEEWDTNENKSNAFGKCVSKTARES